MCLVIVSSHKDRAERLHLGYLTEGSDFVAAKASPEGKEHFKFNDRSPSGRKGVSVRKVEFENGQKVATHCTTFSLLGSSDH